MYYLVGLGNTGEEYATTRHNVGWLVLDNLCERHHISPAVLQNSVSGRVSVGKIAGVSVSVLYPETMMNNSGAAVRKFVPDGEGKRLVVLYDDIDLPLGVVRVSFGRGNGGHNGIKSIIDKLGTRDFVRVRIGIGKVSIWPWQKGQLIRPQADKLPKFVLGKFSKHELQEVEKVTESVNEIVTVIVQYGHITAMNRYN
ncbi:aminoacyl-tRNA hydrolase [Patescibacteria group bacterium]|nr:aminoacyl-tRNA hydrolase [Patescibacteria group bacterium]